MIFPALYNGPINLFSRLVREEHIVLEQFDHYQKQTYRNRCRILGPNGIISLSIPVIKVHGTKSYLRDIRIDYTGSWNRNHWRSLVAAYASSPYFGLLADELVPYYERKYEYLIDLNIELLERTLKVMGLNIPASCSSSFTEMDPDGDPRQFIHPKKKESVEDPDFLSIEYHQVFSDRFGFVPNLSILDLLFNEGPNATGILRQSLRTYNP